ncbi:lysophospholipid acyltransferase family protein [bacterium]|nr:lysophospholipid acyltransferase family protein [bacterium]
MRFGFRAILKDFSWSLSKFPRKITHSFAVIAGVLASRLWIAERKYLFETIDRVYFRKGLSLPSPVSTVIDKLFIHFSLNLHEIMRMPEISDLELERKFVWRGLENLDSALALNRGVILIVPHIGNWELLGAAIAHRGYPLHSFYMAQKDEELGSSLDEFRTFSKIVLHDRDRGLREAFKALKSGEILGMISDQDGGNHGVYTDFLGHWVSIPAGPANWSLKTGASIVPLYSLRKGISDRFEARFFPSLPMEPIDSHDRQVVSRTLKIVKWLESVILRHPEQYLWFYDRFKPRHEAYITRLKTRGFKMRENEACYEILDGA